MTIMILLFVRNVIFGLISLAAIQPANTVETDPKNHSRKTKEKI